MVAVRRSDDGAAIDFGQRILSLLDTGSFTASYKYAVLLALLDAVLEGTDGQGRPPTVLRGRDIARRVLELYWPQARPFTDAGPLAQSRQRDLVAKIAEFRVEHGIAEHATVQRARTQHADAFSVLEREVVATVIRYPIPLLQRVGVGGRAVEHRFIYTYAWRVGVGASTVQADGFDDRMPLVDGAGRHLAALAGLLRPVIERAWLQFVAARNDADVEELRLQQFLFGAERVSLGALVEPLHAVQDGACFYCDGAVTSRPEIDHFLPWARLPDDKLDNLVLAHAHCNNDKRAALAGMEHLARWTQRFEPMAPANDALEQVAVATAWPRRPAATLAAARALYLHQPAGTPLWVGPRGRLEPLDRDRLLAVLRTDVGLAADESGSYRS